MNRSATPCATAHIKPARPNLLVALPDGPGHLPADGLTVKSPLTTYWRKRIKDGDVITTSPAALPAPTAAEDPASPVQAAEAATAVEAPAAPAPPRRRAATKPKPKES
ncbi:DUF2635 domain-containing protein [Magnetococcus sp. PR-3]|uniref:DUF2635 domain-containing protein n=1 Tax=Magnetococcus sp. PR-3 TaxID=3120355 RepID=UPI003FA52E17